MWSRVVEAMLGCWLLVSPLIFSGDATEPTVWLLDLLAGSSVVLLALLSYWSVTKIAHRLTLALAIGLALTGYWHGLGQPTPVSQNHMLCGLILFLFALVPNEACQPPLAWNRQPSPRAE